MSGYINYYADSKTNKIPFCMGSAPTTPSLAYYYSGCHYLPLVDALTTSQCGTIACAKNCPGAYLAMGGDGYSGTLYYATKPALTVQTSSGTRYVANTYQTCMCAHYTTRSCKCSNVTNNYDSYSNSSGKQTVYVCCCQGYCTYRSNATGVSNINRMSTSNPSGQIICDCYSGTYSYGAFPTPDQLAASTGVAVCTNGIIGNKWVNTQTARIVDFGACCATAWYCADYSGYWRYNALTKPAICLWTCVYVSTSGSEGTFYCMRLQVCLSSAVCHTIYYTGYGGCICESDSKQWGCITVGNFGWGTCGRVSLFKSSVSGNVQFRLCYPYGKKYYTIPSGNGARYWATTWADMTAWS